MKTYSSDRGEIHRFLTFEEKIRMNSLIQGGIDLKSFQSWYAELNSEERMALTRTLLDVFICEQHYSGGKEVVSKALSLAEKSLEDPLIKSLLDSVGGFDSEVGLKDPWFQQNRFYDFVRPLSDEDRSSIFEFCVFLFGVHEGERLEACSGKCDHWWHQNLKDPAVVRKLLQGR